MYLQSIIFKYSARDLNSHRLQLAMLKGDLQNWASSCFVSLINSGSRAKGTAISLASDVDFLISLTSGCNASTGGLKSIYDSLHTFLQKDYRPVRKQNVSFRINLSGLEVDITPARKQAGNINYHSLYVSKKDTWTQTNIQIHINEISKCGRLNEIKLLKIWRELNGLDFPSIYLEYLVLSILSGKAKGDDQLADNFWFILNEFSKTTSNPLSGRIVDPANSANILSELINPTEKNAIINRARLATAKTDWKQIVW